MPDSASPLEAPRITQPEHARRLNRRGLLRGGGAIAGSALAASLVQTSPVAAQPASGEPPPAMRSPRNPVFAAAAGAPSLPPLPVIVFNRMAFGPRPEDWQAFQALGNTPESRLEAYVEQQLAPETIDDSECEARLASYGFTTLDKSLAQLWADHVQGDQDRYLPAREVERVTLIRAVYSKRQLVEVLADHWHNHFNVYGFDYWIAPVFVHYDRDVIRGHMLGNFRQMLEAVAQSPAMLFYLDNQSNSGGSPNENYARELFELHTMGAENYLGVRSPEDPALVDGNGNRVGYIDADVYGATTCFTGWRVNMDTGLFEFDSSRHFPYQKFVLGKIIPDNQGIKDGHDVLDLLASHPGTARHVCRRLCRRLIADHPPESVVQAAADVFLAHKDAPDQLKRVVRTILLSDEFRTTWGQKVKRPFEYVVAMLRATQADFEPTDSFLWNFGNSGQRLFRWHPPDGYPDFKEAWSSTMPMLQRWRRCNWLLGWTYGGDGPNKDDYRLQPETQMPASKKTPNEIVDYWSNRILGRTLPADERQPIVEFMAHGRNPDYELPADQIQERLRYMVGLILMSPSFHWR